MKTSLSFKQRIGVLVALVVVGLVISSSVALVKIADLTRQGRQSELVAAVQVLQSTVLAYQAQATAGKMSVADAQEAAKKAVRLARYGGPDGKTNYVFLMQTDGLGLAHPRKEYENATLLGKAMDPSGKDNIRELLNRVAESSDGTAMMSGYFTRVGSPTAVPKIQYAVRIPGWDWLVGSGVYLDQVDADIRSAIIGQCLQALVLVLVVGGIGLAVMRSVMRQIGGEPAAALEAMNQVAEGHLGIEFGSPPPGSVMAGLERTVAALRETMNLLRQSADSIGTASSEIALGNQDLSQRTEQTASSLQQTASSMSQLTGAVHQSAEAAAQANELAASASSVASRGGEAVARVVSTMDEINASARKIAQITGEIDGIAFQTNILALNAAVEAARAGEQGRGFAVVAGEVRLLAQRSAGAAKEIKSLIGTSVDKVEAGTRLVRDAGSTMTEIVASVERVSHIIGEITTASGEQSSGLAQINQAVAQLDRMTQQNAALVEQSSAAAESLQGEAQKLSGVVASFRMP